jgi:hypothetical protein
MEDQDRRTIAFKSITYRVRAYFEWLKAQLATDAAKKLEEAEKRAEEWGEMR